MSRYHVDPASGAPEVCIARSRSCSFGKDDAHYTSEASARSAYELSHGALIPLHKLIPGELDLQAILKSAKNNRYPTSLYSEHLDDKAVGSVVMGSKQGEARSTYLVKTEHDKWFPLLVDEVSGVVKLGVLAYSVLAMEHRGASNYYFTEEGF